MSPEWIVAFARSAHDILWGMIHTLVEAKHSVAFAINCFAKACTMKLDVVLSDR